MGMLLSRYVSPELFKDYAALSVRLSVVELQLGNVGAAKAAVEESIQCHPTAEVCVHVLCVYVCMHSFIHVLVCMFVHIYISMYTRMIKNKI